MPQGKLFTGLAFLGALALLTAACSTAATPTATSAPAATPTATSAPAATPTKVPATATSAPAATPTKVPATATSAPAPTGTPVPTPAPTKVPATATPVPTATPIPAVTSNIVEYKLEALSVKVGTVVTWVNKGTSTHLSSSPGTWNSNDILPGKSYSFTFTQAGSYPYFCLVHSSMNATVTVS